MMDCIDKELRLEDVEDRIARFILKDLDEPELDDFIEHMVDCQYCDTMAISGLKAKRVFQQQITYEKLCAAHDNKDWEEVIRLGGEMEALGYDKEVHPIEDRYKKAIDAISVELLKELGILLDNKKFDKAKELFFKVSSFKLKSKETQEILQSYKQTATELYLNDKTHDFSAYGMKLLSKLYYACKVTIKMFGEVVFERDLTNSDLFEFSGSFNHADSDQGAEIFRSEQMKILIQKGKSEAKLHIILLNDQVNYE